MSCFAGILRILKSEAEFKSSTKRESYRSAEEFHLGIPVVLDQGNLNDLLSVKRLRRCLWPVHESSTSHPKIADVVLRFPATMPMFSWRKLSCKLRFFSCGTHWFLTHNNLSSDIKLHNRTQYKFCLPAEEVKTVLSDCYYHYLKN